MSENRTPQQKKSTNPDWFLRGILAKVGDTFDRFTGRKWQPSSNLATSELIERLKKLLDAEVKVSAGNCKYVPHNIELKMQWNKFSTDSDEALKLLEHELLAAAIDHINDNRYHTSKPLRIKVKPDYFTEGVRLMASFGEFDDENEVAVNVSVPQMNVKGVVPESVAQAISEPEGEVYVAEFHAAGKDRAVELTFLPGKRLGVGRTKDNDLTIEDGSISKIHASLVVNSEGKLLVADTGSTNGTFINDQRIAYGKAFAIGENDKLKFGTVDVFMRRVPKATDFATHEEYDVAPLLTQNFEASATPTEAFNDIPQQPILPQQTYTPPQPVVTAQQQPPLQNLVPPQPTVAFPGEEIRPQASISQNETPSSAQTVADIPGAVSGEVPGIAADGTFSSEGGEVFSTQPRVRLDFDEDNKT